VVAYWGHDVPTDELDQTLPKAKKGGVLLLDMLLAARHLGFSAELIFGEPAVLRDSIEAGRPLILMLRVFDSIGDSRDLYHYVIVDGFDSHRDLVRIQYGDGAARWVSLERLSRSWNDTDFATLVIEPGEGGLGVNPSIRYAVALEEQDRLDEAVTVYEQVLEDDPGSALAWTNLGNVEAARNRLAEAEAAYRRALEIDPNNIDTLNNLAWLLLEKGSDLDRARQLAAHAVAQGGVDSYLALDTLGRIELATDRCEAAIDAFSKALEAVPRDSSARAEITAGLLQSRQNCPKRDSRD
jgi:tetratricopeptide (TPR) repeat protein